MYLYKAYGLIFTSELALPEMDPAQGTPDVAIRIGKVPRNLKNAADVRGFFQATEREFLFGIEETAGYYVKNGNEITIEPYVDIGAPDIRLYLLGSALGALLQQRGFLVLHGACVAIDGKGVLFTGKSGIGKSTLAAALHNRGYELLTDDVSAVMPDVDGVPFVVPGFPSIKLWQDAAEKLDECVDDLEPVMANRDKYRVSMRNYHTSPIHLAEVYLLGVHDSKRIEIAPVSGIAKLEALIRNTYRYRYLDGQGIKSRHFLQCIAVAERINVYRILRPSEGFRIEELADAVERIALKDAL